MKILSRVASRLAVEIREWRLRTLASLVPSSVVSFLSLSAVQREDPFLYEFHRSLVEWGDLGQAREQIDRWGISVMTTDFDRLIALATVDRVVEIVEVLEDVGGHDAARKMGVKISDGTQSYSQLVSSDCPVFTFRKGLDEGMVDIFHADRIFPQLSGEVSRVVQSSRLLEFLGEMKGRSYELTNFNLYLNRSVQATRGWHVDSYGDTQYKAFIYLSDVDDLASGPYCYVPGSPRDRGFRIVNEVLSIRLGRPKTDVILYDSAKAIPLLGPVGTLVVSNQSGAHRGFPQAKGRSRCIVALNLRPTGTYET